MTPPPRRPRPRRLKVLVVGAGIAGNATAHWLAKLGHAVTVIERHPTLRVNGLQLDLRGHGIAVMRRMGLEEAVRAKCVPEEGVSLVDSSGRERAFFAANRTGKGAQSMSSEFEIMRGDLCCLLKDAAVALGAAYVFGVTVDGFRQEEEEEEENVKVKVKFSDGRTDTFDLVVGCDGQGSRVRRLMLAEVDAGEGVTDSVLAKDTVLTQLPERFGYFTMPLPMREGEKYICTAYLMPDQRFCLTRRHNPDEIQVYLRCEARQGPMSTVRKGDVKAEKEAFAEIFQGAGWKTDEFVKALREEADDFYCQYSGVVKLDSWSRGRVTLVGDAGYCCPPDGFGTSMALVGAYVLAGEIQRCCGGNDKPTAEDGDRDDGDKDEDGVLAALQGYQAQFQPYMKQLQSGYSAEPTFFDRWIPWTAFTVELFNTIAGMVSFFKLDQLAIRFFPAEGERGWKLPAYEEMVVNVQR